MKSRTRLDTAHAPDGTLVELFEHDGHHEIRAGGQHLMSSRRYYSEQELARLACVDLPPKPIVLIGGLGIGYTLRAALDLLPANGRVVQVELVPEVVEWNRGPLGAHADRPLDDPRTELVLANVSVAIRRYQSRLAAILLDVDNGPKPIVEGQNAWLYRKAGLETLHRALVPGGRVAIWAAADEPGFVRQLRSAGFDAERHESRARTRRKGARHYVFVGRRRRSGPGVPGKRA